MEKQIIVVCGLPLSGKSTVARELKRALKIPWVDVDTVRQKLFHHPQAEMEQNKDRFQRIISYHYLFLMAYRLLEKGFPVILTATFSRHQYHEGVVILSEATGASLKAVYCYASDKVIADRIARREERQDGYSTCRTLDHYFADKSRYQKLSLEFLLEVDTSKPIEENIEKIVKFVIN